MKRTDRILRYVLGLLLTAFMTLGQLPETVIPALAGQNADCMTFFTDSAWQNGENDGDQKTSMFSETRKKKKKNSSTNSSDTKETEKSDASGSSSGSDTEVTEDGTYTSKEEVAAYIHTFGHLPDNYITKNDAKDLGWDSSKGNLDEVAPGKSIGGDHFGNYEGQLPEKKGRKYYECDIDYTGGYRGSKRIIYSDDGLIYYTEDHYTTFEQLY